MTEKYRSESICSHIWSDIVVFLQEPPLNVIVPEIPLLAKRCGMVLKELQNWIVAVLLHLLNCGLMLGHSKKYSNDE